MYENILLDRKQLLGIKRLVENPERSHRNNALASKDASCCSESLKFFGCQLLFFIIFDVLSINHGWTSIINFQMLL